MSAAPIAARAARLADRSLSEQRSHQRFPIELEVAYRLLSKDCGGQLGSGKTRNISSRGVLFESGESVPSAGSIELMMPWPILLEGVCRLKLVIQGRIVRSDGHKVAIESKHYEFRTAGPLVAHPQPAQHTK
jgi:hypothetical protein